MNITDRDKSVQINKYHLLPLIKMFRPPNKKILTLLVLLAMASMLSMVFFDQTAVAIILPTIQKELKLSSLIVPWIMNSYLLSIAVFIIFSGKLSEILGHKKVIIFGSLIFFLSSILCAISNFQIELILARFIQGIGAAFIIPSAGVIMINHFPKEVRGKMMSLYIGIASIFLSLGPLIGGYITEYFSWRLIFWLNVPVSIIGASLTFCIIKDSKTNKKRNSFNWYCGITFAISIAALVVGLMNGNEFGWSSIKTFGLFFVFILFSVFFIIIEKKFKNPIFDIKLFKNIFFIKSCLIFACIQTCLITLIFFSIFIQKSLQYSPGIAGILILPATLPTFFIAPLGGILLDRYGPRLPICTGMLILMIGMLWIAFFSVQKDYWSLLPGFILYGIGIPLCMQSVYTTSLSALNKGFCGRTSRTAQHKKLSR